MKTYEIVLRPRSSFLTPFQSDTLFGSICWAIRYLHGEEVLVEFLKKYQTSPPLVISSGFPTGWFPKPIRESLSREQVKTIAEEIYGNVSKKNLVDLIKTLKEIKKSVVVNQQDFEAIINGLSEIDYFKKYIHEDEKKIGGLIQTVYKNTINRATGRTRQEGGLFTQDETFYDEISTISIFTKVNEYEIDFFENILEFISFNGFGKRKSVGKGQFEVMDIKEYEFKSPANPNAFVSLSSYIPSVSDPPNGWYELMVKYGKLGGNYANCTKINPFKKPLRIFKPGAVFKTSDVKEYYGQIIQNVHENENIVHYGLAFPVGMKI